MQKNASILVALSLSLLLALGLALLGVLKDPGDLEHTWTEAKRLAAAGELERVIFQGNQAIFEQKLAPGEAKPKKFGLTRVESDEEALIRVLEEKGVTYTALPPSDCTSGNMATIMMMMMMVMLFVSMSRREGGVPPGVATFGKSSAKLMPEEGTGVTFADVAGVDEGIEELQEIVQFLRTPNRFTALGGRIPKGVLLVGPPGTGKTLLARAVAGEAGVPFFSISGSDFVEMFVGVGAARVRDLFQKAAEQAPCIIFIDELDAVGKARGGNTPVGGQDEREQTLNQILVEMDGFDGRKGIIIVAATNRPETLDPALLRAGRFDRQVVVDRPDFRGREAILKVHARALKLAEDVDLGAVARMTPGFAGADLANALNEAALLAARHDKKSIEMSDIDAAVERIVAGLEKKSRRLSEREKRVVAFHESGHAICAAASPGADPVQKISIIPRGVGALGYTLQTPAEDRYLMSQGDLRNRIVTLYGGRVAEELVFADVTTGASDDIRKASDLARRMVSQFGMSSRMGAVDYGGEHYSPFGPGGPGGRDVPLSEDTARELDAEVRALLGAAHDDARRVLLAHQDLLFRMSTRLLEEEVLDREVLATLLAEVAPLASLPSLGALREAWRERELPALPVRPERGQPPFPLLAPDEVEANAAEPSEGEPQTDEAPRA